MRPLLARLLRIGIARPLTERDYAMLTVGSLISLLGDGFFFVALAWQVYQISNVPTAMTAVGIAWTLPLIATILLGGVLSDRYDRRWLMVGADLLRGVAIAAMGILSVAGVLELWHVVALMAVIGLGDAIFNPASVAIVPDLLTDDLLPPANALQGTVRPLMAQLAGPAIAGLVVAGIGPGAAFLVDAATFGASALAVANIRHRSWKHEAARGIGATFREIGEGLAFVRGQAWIWATLVSAMLGLLVVVGPRQTLVPFLIKNRLGLGPEALGATFAAGGVGAILAALVIGQVGLPARRVTVMYAAWAAGVGLMAIYGVMTQLWQALVVSFVIHGLFELGQIIWTTLLQQRVPRGMLGRVSSLDWLVSIGLVPVSYALTGPVAGAFGATTTMVGAGLLGAVLMGGLLFFPGVRDPERERASALGGEATE
ncbi:MAG: MFS transporter [Chloroflexota bacterium]